MGNTNDLLGWCYLGNFPWPTVAILKQQFLSCSETIHSNYLRTGV